MALAWVANLPVGGMRGSLQRRPKLREKVTGEIMKTDFIGVIMRLCAMSTLGFRGSNIGQRSLQTGQK